MDNHRTDHNDLSSSMTVDKTTPPSVLTSPRQSGWRWPCYLAICVTALLLWVDVPVLMTPPAPSCLQPGALIPSLPDAVSRTYANFTSSAYRSHSARLLSDGVRIPTVSYDDMGEVGEDSRWEVFASFRRYLHDAFPLVHARLSVEHVNTHALIYTWHPLHPTAAKPLLLMAHQDVVPVDPATHAAWTHPPFSGHIDDDGWVWGRGASDCKNSVVAIMEALESLVCDEVDVVRPVVISFGFDEETTGYSARSISQRLESVYGVDGFAMVVDEGEPLERREGGVVMALPGVGEKGYMDVTVEVTMPGGHSSIPPPHTAIGVLAAAITAIEDAPYTPTLSHAHPLFHQLTCLALHAPNSLSRTLRNLIARSNFRAIVDAIKDDLGLRYLMATSVAVDVVDGGVKVNALPESAKAIVNHRIAIDSSSQDVRQKISGIVMEVAKSFGLGFSGFGEAGMESRNGMIVVGDNDQTLEPAPVTPIDTPQWKLLGGTFRRVFGEEVIVAPGMSTGNTDTKSMWALSKHIYRLDPMLTGARDNHIHTVDEKVHIDGHLEAVRFFHTLILNFWAADDF
ncbi:hypothetical protein PYCC9005_004776 [Savitreella phatthalungensis]